MESSAINVTQILTTLITTVGAIVCAVVGKKAESRPAPEPSRRSSLSIWAWGMWICIAIAVVNSGILGLRILRPLPPTEVAITYPTDLSRVEHTEMIRGTVMGVPEEHAIWAVVFVQEVGRYFPQNQPADLEAGKQWSSLVYIGIPSDTGKRFDILAVVADISAQKVFETYLADAKDRSDWAGMEALPEGAITNDRITVTRK